MSYLIGKRTALNRPNLTAETRFCPGQFFVRIVVDQAALGYIFLRAVLFSPQ